MYWYYRRCLPHLWLSWSEPLTAPSGSAAALDLVAGFAATAPTPWRSASPSFAAAGRADDRRTSRYAADGVRSLTLSVVVVGGIAWRPAKQLLLLLLLIDRLSHHFLIFGDLGGPAW